MGKRIDITGNKYGKLTVIEELKERNKDGKIVCRCICECGNYCNIKKINLTKGKTKSCGCSTYDSNIKDEDFINKKFGEFEVLSFSRKNDKGVKLYNCKCSCGNIVEVNCYNLKNGASTNCGCKRNNKLSTMARKNIIGKKFGKLTVIKEIGVNNNGKVTHLCKCDCGNEIIATTGSLTSGHTISCGCVKSHGNYLLTSILRNKGIEYKPEYYIDLSNSDYNVSRLSFDVYLPKYNVAIEYDGEQHYYPCNLFGGEEGFKRTQERDKIKNEYCKENGIILYRISYKDKDIIEDIIDDIINELIIANND